MLLDDTPISVSKLPASYPKLLLYLMVRKCQFVKVCTDSVSFIIFQKHLTTMFSAIGALAIAYANETTQKSYKC